MKKLFVFIILSSLFLSSCFNCTWVQTGYHYDDDDNYVEDGYYDCPDENPVDINSEPINYRPNINIGFSSKTTGNMKNNYYDCLVTLSNNGNIAAENISCKITIKRPYVQGFFNEETKVIDFNTTLLPSANSTSYSFHFSDMAYTGCCMFTVDVMVSYTYDNGKHGTAENGFDL